MLALSGSRPFDLLPFIFHRVLENETTYQLQYARIARAADSPKTIDVINGTVCVEWQVSNRQVGKTGKVYCAVDAGKLRVIERIEGVDPEFETNLFLNRYGLLQRDVPVADARSGQIVER